MLSVRPIAANDWRAYRAIRLRALQDAPSAFGSSWSQEATWGDEPATVGAAFYSGHRAAERILDRPVDLTDFAARITAREQTEAR